ncbi:aminotransferase class I/II-fold pyridoxal phosphate-dependent enzyme [Aquimarina gracilis]|uniref:Aminotransferase class I/II-fold pyridoxal phosphate-dependent enzyme n=1 Tax=Aquimarina gracilis TaxID=874422 RepID=A0ABU5ZXI9_9FLAO|nr:aminotransferase class I/II-fold pyridoxal phosphate-dependent enzyme [Aquimarina gracilis]MEB3346580.1 aminotransferase class I/II-fold pyridoxal phosphate-dependent enzyme [Aquimarina gracilis]
MEKLIHESEMLKKVYDPSEFRALGHQVVDLLASHIENVQTNREFPVLPYRDPEEELDFWKKDFSSQNGVLDTFNEILDHSINVHHPRYIGHQVSVPALVSGLAGLMSDLLSNGTGVYEMGMAANAIEKIITDLVAKRIGYGRDTSGFLTSGGTLANLTALLAARKAKAPTAVWEHGHNERLAVLVSEEAHYCIDRAARILGMGSDGIIKIPVDKHFRINTTVLQDHYDNAVANGFHVIALIGCSCSTATGSYDDLQTLADFSEQHNLWFHVDGAHGGAVIFSNQFKHLVNGISRADSVVIDFHKMLMTPSLNTGLIFKKSEDAYRTFEQQAQYLWDSQHTQEWYNSGKRTFECTKSMMAIKTYAILKAHGEEVFGENINRLYTLASAFAKMIEQTEGFELALSPEANIINFRYINTGREDVNILNSKIRQGLIKSGKFYIVQTRIKGSIYLRTTIMNSLTQESDLEALLTEIKRIAQN